VIPQVILAVVTIIGSWLLVHTIFAMHQESGVIRQDA